MSDGMGRDEIPGPLFALFTAAAHPIYTEFILLWQNRNVPELTGK